MIRNGLVFALAALTGVVSLSLYGQTMPAPHTISTHGMAGVQVIFGNPSSLYGLTPNSNDGLSHGTGQFGAPTVYACNYDYRTHVIADFPANISSGWIVTNIKSNESCIPPGGLSGPNWTEMTYFLDLPVGTNLRVCWNGNTWPANWTPVSYSKNASLCGYWPSGVPIDGYPNVMNIRRDR